MAALVLLSACSSGSTRREAAPTSTPAPMPSRPGTSDVSPTTPSEPWPAYAASVQPIPDVVADRMRDGQHPDCPVSLVDLRYLRLSFVGFDHAAHTGVMVVYRDYAQGVVDVFEALYDARWPIRRMRLVDGYGGDDEASMAANNSSAYNCRRLAGSDTWSTHAYGAAIDLNPVQNPFVTASSVVPAAGRPFATIDRSVEAQVPAGVVQADDVVVRAFARIGWVWGGTWSTSKDYQHFSATGR